MKSGAEEGRGKREKGKGRDTLLVDGNSTKHERLSRDD